MSDTVIREVKAGLWLGALHLRTVGGMEGGGGVKSGREGVEAVGLKGES